MNKFESIVKQKTTEELVDIIINSHDYQADFIKNVKIELEERNMPLDSINQIKEKASKISDRNIEQGEQGNVLYIALCYFAALLGGIISIIAGYIYAFSKRKDLKGVSHFYYNKQTRKHGKWMLVTGCIMFFIWLLLSI